MFKSKKLLITGGTGSFGNAVLRRFLDSEVEEIRILSRDEKKQDDMRQKYQNVKLKFYLGDVRDPQSLQRAIKGVDYIFHAAALKQVPSCEFFPMEAVKTNVIGTQNVLETAINCGVKKVICLSTDKAVYPINAMGMSKALMEKVIVAQSRQSDQTIIAITRYGNVMASRGSVIPLFTKQIREAKPITITDPKMTRFMMTLDDAVDLVIYAFNNAGAGDIFVQKAPAATIQTLATALFDVLDAKNRDILPIGTRHGEKIFEVLLSREEVVSAQDLGAYYKVPPDNRNLNYDSFFENGQIEISEAVDFNSHNTEQLDKAGMKKLLQKLRFVKNNMSGIFSDPEE